MLATPTTHPYQVVIKSHTKGKSSHYTQKTSKLQNFLSICPLNNTSIRIDILTAVYISAIHKKLSKTFHTHMHVKFNQGHKHPKIHQTSWFHGCEQ